MMKMKAFESLTMTRGGGSVSVQVRTDNNIGFSLVVVRTERDGYKI